MTEAQVTLAREWRKPREEGYLVELPSGNVARLGPVDLSQFLLDGDIPDLLAPFVARMLFEGVSDEELDAEFAPEKALEKAGETMQLINTICRASFIEPCIVDEDPGEDAILIEDVTVDDRNFVFSVATRGVMALKSFRVGQEEDVEPLPDSEGDGSETEPASGD